MVDQIFLSVISFSVTTPFEYHMTPCGVLTPRLKNTCSEHIFFKWKFSARMLHHYAKIPVIPSRLRCLFTVAFFLVSVCDVTLKFVYLCCVFNNKPAMSNPGFVCSPAWRTFACLVPHTPAHTLTSNPGPLSRPVFSLYAFHVRHIKHSSFS